MTDTFISYSRKDIAFAKIVHESLQNNQLDTWIDWQDIPPSADWFAEIKEAIEQADTFIFIISPSSVKSEICSREIAHAELNNKRLIPVVIGDIDAREVPATLQSLNWIFFKKEDRQYAKAISDLMTAITLDQPWLKEHTRIQNRALEWERSRGENGYLLHGADLVDAESWLAHASAKDPAPTTLQTQYILASRAQAARRQRRTLAAVAAGLVIAVLLGILAWTQRNVAVAESSMRATAQNEAVAEANMRATAENEAIAEANMRATAQNDAETARVEAERQRDIAVSRYIADRSTAQLEENRWSLALLLAVEAGRRAETYEAINALRGIFAAPNRLLMILDGHEDNIASIALSPDKSLIATAGDEDLTVRIWDAVSGEVIRIIDTSRIWNIAWSANGDRLMGVGETGISVWEVATGEQLYWVPPKIESSIVTASWVDGSSKLLVFYRGSEDGRTGFYPVSYAAYDGASGDEIVSSQEDLYTCFRGELASHDQSHLMLWKRIEDGYQGEYSSWDTFAGQVIDWQTGEILTTFPATYDQWGLLWSPDDSKIALQNYGEYIQIWEAKTGELLQEIPADSSVETYFDPSGSRILITQCDQRRTSGTCIEASAHLWDIETGQELNILSGFQREIKTVSWNPGEDRLITASYDPAFDADIVIYWDAEKGTELRRLELPHYQGGYNLQLEWGVEGGEAFIRGPGGMILWDVVSGKIDASIRVEPPSFQDVLWDSKTAQGISVNGNRAEVFSLEPSGEGPVLFAHSEGVSSAVWHPRSTEILTAGCEAVEGGDVCIRGSLKVWDVESGDLLHEFEGHEGSVQAVWNQTGDRIISAGSDDTLRMWDASIGAELLQILHPHTVAGVTGLAWSPDETRILTYVKDLFHNENNAWIWDAGDGAMLLEFSPVENIQDVLQTASWSSDGSRVLTFISDMSLHGTGSRAQVWDSVSGEEKLRLVFGDGHQAVGGQAIWSPKGDRIFVLDSSSDVFGVWDAQSGDEIWSYQYPDSIVNSGAWSPDGSRVAVGLELDWLEMQGMESVVRIYNSRTGKEVANLLGHTDHIRQLIWSQDGASILSRSDDNTIRIWNSSSGEQLNQLIRNQGDLTSVDWSPDERYILTPSEDGTVRIWYTRMEDLLEAACQIAPRNMSEHEWQTYFGDELYHQTCPNLPS